MIGNYLSSPRHNRNVWQALAERLPSRGWEVRVTSTKESQILRLLDMLTTIVIKRNHYDLVQIDVFSGKAFFYAEFCAGLLRIIKKPIVLTLHGGGLPSFANRQPKRVSNLLSLAIEVVTPSPFLQQSLSIYHNKIKVIPNGIDISAIAYRARKPFSANLVWVRAFHQIYNPELAVRVLSGLVADYPNTRLTMVGPDKGDGSLQAVNSLAKKLGVDDQLIILPAVPYEEVPFLLDKADIFINTTNYDTAPRSLLEAMANGVCVVSTNVGGIPWMITNFQDGLLVPPEDELEMVNAIKSLLEEPEFALRISKNARQTAERNDWLNVIPEWDNLFSDVLAGVYGQS
jgi:glycosyltransferase involved in cell wall biosynthesis